MPLTADIRSLLDCLVNQHDGGASAEQLMGVLGWNADRLADVLAWLVERDLVSLSLGVEAAGASAYVRQTARTASYLGDG